MKPAWGLCYDAAKMAGAALAAQLRARGSGARPTSLLGVSLGARVVWYCLELLAALPAAEAAGLVQARLFGPPMYCMHVHAHSTYLHMHMHMHTCMCMCMLHAHAHVMHNMHMHMHIAHVTCHMHMHMHMHMRMCMCMCTAAPGLVQGRLCDALRDALRDALCGAINTRCTMLPCRRTWCCSLRP